MTNCTNCGCELKLGQMVGKRKGLIYCRPCSPGGSEPGRMTLPVESFHWIPGTGETPFMTRSGRKLLYVWQPSTGRKAYLDVGTDLILSDEDARLALGMG